MLFNRLDARLLGRLVLLGAVLAGGGYAAQHHAYGLALGALGLLLVLAVSLTRYLTRGQQALADFTLALKYRDFSRQYPVQSVPVSLRPLHAAFNQVNATFRELRAAQEGQFQYLQTILALLDTGIVSYDAAGTVAWVNEAFKQVLAAQQAADSSVNQARTYAQQVIARAEGEAASFDRVYTQYKLAPEVTRRRMYYETMERVLSKVDKTIVEAPGVTPYLPLRELKRSPEPAAGAGQ